MESLRENAPIKYQARNPRVKTLALKPSELTPHPLLDRVNMLPELIAREEALGLAQGKGRAAHKEAAEQLRREFHGVAESILANGIREKLKVVPNPAGGYWIVDGRHRWTIATQYDLETVPCEVVAESDVVAIIMDGVQHRQMSKGARAYLAVLMHPEVAKDAKDRQKAGTPSAFSAEGIAATAGVSPRLMEDAISLYRTFATRGDIREKFEPAIWVGAGLAKLRAGIEGFKKTGTEPDEEPETDEQAKARIAEERVQTVQGKWVEIKSALKFWHKMKPESQKDIIRHAAACIFETPEDFRRELIEALKGGAA
jgi:hypothetical protein